VVRTDNAMPILISSHPRALEAMVVDEFD
jgi:hypothetical protein